MNTETNTSDRQVRRLSLVMFLAGIPIAWLVYFGFMDGSNDSLVLRMQHAGGVVWLAWLVRSFWRNPPRSFSVTLWSISLLWHLQFVPFVFAAALHVFLFYLVAHAMIMAGFSGLLLVRDRGEQGGAGNPLHAQ